MNLRGQKSKTFWMLAFIEPKIDKLGGASGTFPYQSIHLPDNTLFFKK
jgi:hypothetical protein